MENSDPIKNITPSRELAWYIPDLSDRITAESHRVLENYGGIPSGDVLGHIHTIRDKAWEIRPYPCTGLGTFLQPTINLIPPYKKIIETLKNGGSFLDVGCFLGQDLRRLVFDGAPSGNLYGIDIVSHWGAQVSQYRDRSLCLTNYWTGRSHLGYELYHDEDKFEAHFIEADLIKPFQELSALEGKMDVIQVTHVFHQWGWEGQIGAAKEVVKFSKPGSLVVGFQAGTAGGTTKIPVGGSSHSWMRQDPGSWAEMWEVVGKETGTRWKSEAFLLPYSALGVAATDVEYLGPLSRLLRFVVTRQE
ncbi:S-adenosyl-L-methionine-dependent methyltransferase [Glarea lozoyensis ATCC 20868]|uniref:S-adenosyl-L-methionine-dependent methyltransferase n=1 Tax=Glarea lozoyensis (strain ATCC 20868 / MF5171) TaxID=1116229 RepID=S3CFS4_GLAL2|nr:S-adenosyl-L-methionine-dependent methyltransferase [Glarea lozoyensis ATCC 20868]EPE24760.1 S-adenosyl-L-methionine-dependent methyltransferase [Glarea lozoyensis ATCC 20868]